MNSGPHIRFAISGLLLALVSACAIVDAGNDDSISGYRSWTKVNASPIYLEPYVSKLCVPTPPKWSEQSPHVPRYFTVYVNDIGKEAMLSTEKPQFPVGSIIVKEKVAPAMSLRDANYNTEKTTPAAFEKPELLTVPELLSVMIKREKGFNAECGDWEFRTAKADGTYNKGETIDHCISCHAAEPEGDFTFRSYLD
jgi:hypothetical protein